MPNEDCLQVLLINFCITEYRKNSSLRLLDHRFKDSTKMWRSRLIPFPIQLTPLLEVIRCILSWSIAGTRPCSSLDALSNFVPPSINICCDHPLRAVILTRALRNASVSKDDTISKWHQGSSNREKNTNKA